MDGGQVQRDFDLRFIRIIKEFFRYRRVVEKPPFFRRRRRADADASARIQRVKLCQTIFLQKRVDGLATEAAKILARERERAFAARLATMQTAHRWRGGFVRLC